MAAKGTARLDRLRSEWRLACRHGSLWLVAGALVVAAAAGVASGAAWVRTQRAAAAELLARDEERWAALRTELARAERREVEPDRWRHPGGPAWLGEVGRHATLPPARLAGLSVGEVARRTSQVHVTVDSLDALLSADPTEPAALLTGGWFDLGFVVVAVLPLLLLALTYDVVSAERERGTLALVLAQPVDPMRVVLVKLVLRAGVLLGTLIGAVASGLALTGTTLTDGDVLAPVLAWAVTVGLYGAFWCVVALAVNARGWSSATNAIACLAVWLAVVVVVPSAIQTAAQLAHPMPARTEVVVSVRETASRLETEAREILAQHDDRHPDLRPAGGRRAGDRAALHYAVLQEQERHLAPLLARYEAQRTLREALVAWMRSLSPAFVVQETIDDLAGTGRARYRAFLQQVAHYHDRWRAFFLGRVYRNEAVAEGDYARIPRFGFLEEPQSGRWSRIGVGHMELLLAVVIAALVAVQRLRRSGWTS